MIDEFVKKKNKWDIHLNDGLSWFIMVYLPQAWDIPTISFRALWISMDSRGPALSGLRDVSHLGQWVVSGWWLGHPSEKYDLVSWDDEIPNLWENNKWQPNHQAGLFGCNSMCRSNVT